MARLESFNHALPTQANAKIEGLLEAKILMVSKKHPTLGYKKVIGLMRSMGYQANRKLVQRVRREEECQLPPPKPRQHRQGLGLHS